jgi:hypothetical protein
MYSFSGALGTFFTNLFYFTLFISTSEIYISMGGTAQANRAVSSPGIVIVRI